MSRRHIWLFLGLLPLCGGLIAAQAAEEREHVHIKVRMPELVRKHPVHRQHKSPHKLPHSHHRPLHRQPHYPQQDQHAARHAKYKLKSPHLTANHIDLDWYAAPAPHPMQPLAVLPPDEGDLPADDYGSPLVFDNDIMTTSSNNNHIQQLQPAIAYSSSSIAPAALMAMPTMQQQQQQQEQQQQMVQHMELMGTMAAAAAAAGSSESTTTDTNTLLADDFLAELQRLYANSKYSSSLPVTTATQSMLQQQQTMRPLGLGQAAYAATTMNGNQRYKHKKYLTPASLPAAALAPLPSAYPYIRQQHPHQQQLQQQYYANYYQQQDDPQLYNNNNYNNFYGNSVANDETDVSDLNDNDGEEDLSDAAPTTQTYNTIATNDYPPDDDSSEEQQQQRQLNIELNPVNYQPLQPFYLPQGHQQQHRLQRTATTTKRPKWHHRHQQQEQTKYWQKQQQQQQKQRQQSEEDDSFVWPALRYHRQSPLMPTTAQPIAAAFTLGDVGSVGAAAVTATGSEFAQPQHYQQHQHQKQQQTAHHTSTRYKKRKNRIKRKRNRIVVQ